MYKVEIGKGKKGAYTVSYDCETLAQASILYHGFNIRAPYKKRLKVGSQILLRYIP